MCAQLWSVSIYIPQLLLIQCLTPILHHLWLTMTVSNESCWIGAENCSSASVGGREPFFNPFTGIFQQWCWKRYLRGEDGALVRVCFFWSGDCRRDKHLGGVAGESKWCIQVLYSYSVPPHDLQKYEVCVSCKLGPDAKPIEVNGTTPTDFNGLWIRPITFKSSKILRVIT